MAKKKKTTKKRSKKEDSVNKNTVITIALVLVLAAGLTFFVLNQQNPAGVSASGDEGQVLVTINNEKITSEDLEISKRLLEAQTQQAVLDETALEHAMNQELLRQEAELRGFSISLEEAEQYLARTVSERGGDLEQEKIKLNQQGENYDKLLEEFRQQVIINNLLETEINIAPVSDEEAEKYYDERKAIIFTDREPPEFEVVGDQIKAIMEQQKAREIYAELIQSIKDKSEIVYANI